MRVGTLEDQTTSAFLSKNFVLATHNQLPDLYCTNETIDATAKIPYPSEQIELVTEGVGGGNVRSFFCTPDGKIVSYISGYWKQETYLKEVHWALRHIKSLKTETNQKWSDNEQTIKRIRQAHQESEIAYTNDRDAFLSPSEVEKLVSEFVELPEVSNEQANLRANTFNRLAAFNRLIRSHREAQAWVGKTIQSVLQTIEDEVYTKGAIGCDS